MVYNSFIKTKKHIMIAFDKAVWTIPKGNPFFEAAERFIDEKQFDELFALYQLAGKATEKPIKMTDSGSFPSQGSTPAPKKHVELQKSSDGKYINVDGEKMPAILGKTLLKLISDGKSVEYLRAFWRKLSANPSNGSKHQLFSFLQTRHITICDDGDFVLYKRVRDDFKDFYSGKMDNSPGKIVKMPREEVVEDPAVGCARGLHGAAFDYMPCYHGGNGKIIELKVNPKNVVSVPYECNGDKLRLCEYKVLRLFIGNGIGDAVYAHPTIAPVVPAKPKKKKASNKMDKLLNSSERKKARHQTKAAPPAKPTASDIIPPVKLTVGASRGRVRILRKLVLGIGASEGDLIYCEYTKNKVVLKKEKTNVSSKYVYTVSPDGSFKLSHDVLMVSGLVDKEIYGEVVAGVILIKGR